jgi:predicted N-acyltransferase
MVESMVKVAADNDISSIHVTFCLREQWEALGRLGFLKRQHYQFHWNNNGYKSFDDFLAALSSRKRKAIRKERAAVARDGLTVRALSGPEITSAHWDAFFAFYMDTADRKWGSPYLNREFFHLLGGSLAEKVVLIVAERGSRLVAGALNLRGDDAIFGRNWGCLENHDFLHFEACYYQAIDYAIAHGLKTVEAGAQGEHKIQRGYLPTATYSAHWIADAGFSHAIEEFLVRERRAMQHEIDALADYSPFKAGCEQS